MTSHPSNGTSQTHDTLDSHEQSAERSLILIVEDHPATRKVLACMLEMQGYQAECTANGLEALEWMEKACRLKRYPALILLDLLMPRMDGELFLACLRTRWQTPVSLPPIILFTVDHTNHEELACADVLLKPFHIKHLLDKIDRLLEKSPAAPAQEQTRGTREKASC